MVLSTDEGEWMKNHGCLIIVLAGSSGRARAGSQETWIDLALQLSRSVTLGKSLYLSVYFSCNHLLPPSTVFRLDVII